MNINDFNNKLIECKESHYLALSSCFFLIPVYRGLSCNIYLHSIVSLLSCLVSINYWRNPQYGVRRTIDIIISRIASILFVFDLFRIVRNPYYMVIVHPNIILCLYLFHISSYHFDAGYKNWWKYHICFHFFCSINEYLLLDDYCRLLN